MADFLEKQILMKKKKKVAPNKTKHADSMFLSCHVRVSGSIHTLQFQFSECQGNPCSKQAGNWKFK